MHRKAKGGQSLIGFRNAAKEQRGFIRRARSAGEQERGKPLGGRRKRLRR
jgi:hypothetical protein